MNENRKTTPCKGESFAFLVSPRCGAKTRRGTPCNSPRVQNKRRCRMHGCAPGSGAPKGNQNALKDGDYTSQSLERRRYVRRVIRDCRAWRNGLFNE